MRRPAQRLEPSQGLNMVAIYIPNMSLHKDLTTTLGTVKGEILPLLDGIWYADDTKRHGVHQKEADLAAKGVDPALWLYAATAACPSDIGTTRTCPFSAAFPTHRDSPSN